MQHKIISIISYPFIKYNDLLVKRPLLIKCLTSGVMYAGGDILAQYGEFYNDSKNKHEGAESDAVVQKENQNKIQYSRVAVFFVFGTFIGGPSYHYWFNYLNELPALLWRLKQTRHRGKILRAYAFLKNNGIEAKLDLKKLPKSSPLGKWESKAAKILADQLIFSSLYTFVFFMSIGIMSGCADLIESSRRASELEEANEAMLHKENHRLSNELLKELQKRITKLHENSKELDRRSPTTINPTDPASDPASDPSTVQSIPSSHQPIMNKKMEFNEDDYDKIAAILLEMKKELESTASSSSKSSNDPTWTSLQEVGKTAWQHTKKVYWNTYIADCIIWPPLQLINFTFIPVRLQFLYVNVANLGWNTFLSFMANKKH